MKIDGSVIVITGACGGLGSAMAQRMASQGARLALLDFNSEALNAMVADGRLARSDSLAVPADVTNEQQVDAAFERIAAHFGRIDVLVNNAGITRDAMLLKVRDGQLSARMSLADWEAVIGVNLTGVFLCGRAAAEHMSLGGAGGLIINVSSISRAGNIGQSNYTAAKAGVAALSVTWAKELARYGIRVNTISPGFIGTEMVRAIKPEALAKLRDMIPAGRIGEPEEIAHTVQYLVENDFVNGRNFEVDGGMRL
ncbi:MAG: SDR family oxidoreductase [Xanthomonadales bacterium]|nr:SDR family oxidoreductase [Xanthomonadales bacterium]